jgi:WD40 repeat protein
MASYGPFNKVQALSWAATGLHVAYRTNDRRIQLSLLMEGVQYPTMSLESPSGAAPLVTWSPDGKGIAVAFNSGKDGTVEVWNTATRNPVTKHPGRFGAVTSMAWTSDGKTIATANDNGKNRTIEVWDTTTGQSIISSVVEPYIFTGFRVVAMAWSPDGTRLAYVFDNGEVRIWSRKTDTDIEFSTDISSPSNQHLKAALAWSPDGQRLAFTTANGLIQVRDANSGNPLYSYPGHTKPVNDLAWASNGKSIVSASADGTVQVWGPA